MKMSLKIFRRRSLCQLRGLARALAIFTLFSTFVFVILQQLSRPSSLETAQLVTEGFCPLVSPLLTGWTNLTLLVPKLLQLSDDELVSKMQQNGLQPGGRYEPSECRSRHKLAIIVRYRDRAKHLAVFLRYMHPFLQRQQLNYTIFVIEQIEGHPFNRGIISNIGFVEALKLDTFQCFIIHDIDFIPEDDRNIYTCPPEGKPRHLAYLVEIYDYQLMPIGYFGGAFAVSTKDFRLVNGFSNAYWGWGKEDEDIFWRFIDSNLTVTRTYQEQPFIVNRTRYSMLGHEPDSPNPDRLKLFAEGTRRIQHDGLNNLTYRRLKLELRPLYTYVLADVQP